MLCNVSPLFVCEWQKRIWLGCWLQLTVWQLPLIDDNWSLAKFIVSRTGVATEHWTREICFWQLRPNYINQTHEWSWSDALQYSISNEWTERNYVAVVKAEFTETLLYFYYFIIPFRFHLSQARRDCLLSVFPRPLEWILCNYLWLNGTNSEHTIHQMNRTL